MDYLLDFIYINYEALKSFEKASQVINIFYKQMRGLKDSFLLKNALVQN